MFELSNPCKPPQQQFKSSNETVVSYLGNFKEQSTCSYQINELIRNLNSNIKLSNDVSKYKNLKDYYSDHFIKNVEDQQITHTSETHSTNGKRKINKWTVEEVNFFLTI